MQYTVIIEQGETSWGAYVPDLPGCVAAGETEAEVKKLIQEAIEFHLEDLTGRLPAHQDRRMPSAGDPHPRPARPA